MTTSGLPQFTSILLPNQWRLKRDLNLQFLLALTLTRLRSVSVIRCERFNQHHAVSAPLPEADFSTFSDEKIARQAHSHFLRIFFPSAIKLYIIFLEFTTTVSSIDCQHPPSLATALIITKYFENGERCP